MTDLDSVEAAVDAARTNYGQTIDYTVLLDHLKNHGWTRT